MVWSWIATAVDHAHREPPRIRSVFIPPYVGHRGWLGVYLDVPVDWDEIAEVVTDAYFVVAPKRLVTELDGMAALRTCDLDDLLLCHARLGHCVDTSYLDPSKIPAPSAPHPVAEALWQGAWFLLAIALYIEAGRTPKLS